ncbi:MAG: methyltransferase domain-containing protein, partial [Candidatus Acidiferrum sp.]
MIADAGRFNAYANAIARAVRPGDTVAEIGCGPGVFSLLACRAGARRVFAIESESCIQFARELAAANGFTDRIEFFQSDSRKTE